jgi:D-lactate dehydrogenase
MNILFFNSKQFERDIFTSVNSAFNHEITFLDVHLTLETAVCAKGYSAICCFVNDNLQAEVLEQLAIQGVRLIALRSAGFNHVDIAHAKKLGLTVVRVPKYSPYAVAEFALTLILALNRKILRSTTHVREHDFSLEGLLGFDLHGRTVGIIGTGNIGTVFARIMQGIGCNLIAYDPFQNDECKQLGVHYLSLDEVFSKSDIISLHCPLTPDTHHLINQISLAKMKDGVMLINTSRGAVADAKSLVQGLKSGKIGYLGLDVYEEEDNLFFQDLSTNIIQDDVFARLQTFPNVIITGHQAFFTKEAIHNIATTTLANIESFEKGVGEIFTVS